MSLTYLKPFEEVEKVLAEHRAFLDEFYANGTLLASGPQVPKVGGTIIGKFGSKYEALEFAMKDPFVKTSTAKYDIIEFEAVKKSKEIEAFLN
jgi:uncharacterized protein YciI